MKAKKIPLLFVCFLNLLNAHALDSTYNILSEDGIIDVALIGQEIDTKLNDYHQKGNRTLPKHEYCTIDFNSSIITTSFSEKILILPRIRN